MKANGNGSPEVCAANLIKLVRGEVPYDRVRGRNGALVDSPGGSAKSEADIRWLLNTYEPRVEIESMKAPPDSTINGEFSAVVNIKRKEAKSENG